MQENGLIRENSRVKSYGERPDERATYGKAAAGRRCWSLRWCYGSSTAGHARQSHHLIQVQLVAQINTWTVEEVAGQVALSLEGKALQLLTDLNRKS